MTESEVRAHLERVLREADLAALDLSDPFLEQFGVVTIDNFISRLCTHIAETFVESKLLDERAAKYLENHDEDLWGAMKASIVHICRNHIPFLIYPLEWACDPDNWA